MTDSAEMCWLCVHTGRSSSKADRDDALQELQSLVDRGISIKAAPRGELVMQHRLQSLGQAVGLALQFALLLLHDH